MSHLDCLFVGVWVYGCVHACHVRACVRICCVTHVCIQDKIKEALNHGVVKMNIDTDIQVQLANVTQIIDSQPASQTCLADGKIDVNSVACTLAGISAVHALCCKCLEICPSCFSTAGVMRQEMVVGCVARACGRGNEGVRAKVL